MSKANAERKIYGINACQSFFQRFPERIIRAWITEEAAKISFGPMMKYLAQEKRAYHLADGEELERVTESSHHEGVCLLIQELPVFTPESWLAGLKPGKPVCVLALDGVSNPHNLGAIMRVAAHFGVGAILTENALALRTGSAMRTAEGGATHVMVMGTDNLVKTLNLLKKNDFTVLATSSHESASLYEAALPERLVLVLGEEQEGVSARVLQVAHGRIAIGGTGWVESLNVSVAAGVLLSEFWRQHRVRAPRALRSETVDAEPAAAERARPEPGKSRSDKGHSDKGRSDRGRSGKGRSDNNRSGKGRPDRSRSDKPHSDKSRADRSPSDRSRPEKARAKPAGGDRARSDRNPADKPRADKPKSGKPRSDSSTRAKPTRPGGKNTSGFKPKNGGGKTGGGRKAAPKSGR